MGDVAACLNRAGSESQKTGRGGLKSKVETPLRCVADRVIPACQALSQR